MARQIKAGKKFIYSLETVLKVRNIRETKEKEKFIVSQKEYYDEKLKEQKIEDEKKQQANELKGLVKEGAIADFAKVVARAVTPPPSKTPLDISFAIPNGGVVFSSGIILILVGTFPTFTSA